MFIKSDTAPVVMEPVHDFDPSETSPAGLLLPFVRELQARIDTVPPLVGESRPASGPNSCRNCQHERAVDRAECNACARAWNASNYTAFSGWEPIALPRAA